MFRIESDHRLLSAPFKVRWAGWESDTYTLQRHGWQIAANQDVQYGTLQLLISHPVYKIQGFSDRITMEFMHIHESMRSNIDIPICGMGSKLTVMANNINPTDFTQIDCEPSYIRMEPKSLDDFKIFKESLHRVDEIIVDPLTVNQLMEQIVELQTPKQKEIRERRRKERLRNDGKLESPQETTEVMYNLVRLVD